MPRRHRVRASSSPAPRGQLVLPTPAIVGGGRDNDEVALLTRNVVYFVLFTILMLLLSSSSFSTPMSTTTSSPLDADDRQYFQSQIEALKREVDLLKSAATAHSQCIPSSATSLPPDGTGLADFALHSAGGSVIAASSSSSLPVWARMFTTNSPATAAISASVNVGECWPCRLPDCRLVIRLVNRIRVTAVSIEHAPRELSVSREDTAPRLFTVRNHETGGGALLGRFEYARVGVQTFPINASTTSTTTTTQHVEIELESTWGSGTKVACLYRIRVHGELV